jgi:hypothetical protein
MGITSVQSGGAERRIDEELELRASGAAAEQRKSVRPIDDAIGRIAASDVRLSATTPSAKAEPFRQLREVSTRLAELGAAIGLRPSDECKRAWTESERRLIADLTKAKPLLEKLGRDLETLGRTAGPVAKDVFKIAYGSAKLVRGIDELSRGAAALETGAGALLIVRGYYDVMSGAHSLASGIASLPADIERAKLSGPALDEVLRDLNALEPHLRSAAANARESVGLLERCCVRG